MTRPARAAAVVLLVAAALAGCNDEEAEPAAFPSIEDGGEPADPAGTATLPDAEFTAKVTADSDEVLLDYTLTNTSGGEVLAVNLLPRQVGAATEYSSEEVYVTGQDAGRVVVSQRLFAWPADAKVDFAQAPQVGATRLAAGEAVTSRVRVPLPLERSHPFGNDLGYGAITLPDPVEEVVFCLGVVVPPYPPALSVQDKDGVTTLTHGDEGNRSQYLFCSDPAPLG